MKKLITLALLVLVCIPLFAFTFGSGGACAATYGSQGCTGQILVRTLSSSAGTSGTIGTTGVADPSTGFVYVGSYPGFSSNASVIKYNGTTMVQVAVLPLNVLTPANYVSKLLIDSTNTYLYAVVPCGCANHGYLYKIALSTFTIVTEVDLLNNNLQGAAINSAGSFVYVGCTIGSGSADIYKVDTSTFTYTSIGTSVNDYAMIVDNVHNLLYLGGNGTMEIINLSSFALSGTYSLPHGSAKNTSMSIDETTNKLYIGDETFSQIYRFDTGSQAVDASYSSNGSPRTLNVVPGKNYIIYCTNDPPTSSCGVINKSSFTGPDLIYLTMNTNEFDVALQSNPIISNNWLYFLNFTGQTLVSIKIN